MRNLKIPRQNRRMFASLVVEVLVPLQVVPVSLLPFFYALFCALEVQMLFSILVQPK
jgi:hypothetical protein